MKILAIGSHPDDIEFGCGGTLAKFKKQSEINLLVMTSGSLGGDPKIRQKEQISAAKLLNAKVFWGNFRDTEIPLDRKTIILIEDIIKKTQPDLIFTHHPDDTHQDHRNTSQATLTATRYIRNVLFYEVPTTTDFAGANVFVDITQHIDEKIKLLKLHKSQVFATRISGLSIIDAALAASTFMGYRNRTRYAEGFVPVRLSLDIFWQ